MRKFGFILHRRIGLMIVAVVLATSAIFGLAAIVLAYSVEDELFERALTEEVGRQQGHWRTTGALTQPQLGYVRIYVRQADMPADLRAQMVPGNQQVEYSGDLGRHYHVIRFGLGEGGAAPHAVAVAEVSQYLVVRPTLKLSLIILSALSAAIAATMGLIGFLLAKRSLKPLNRLATAVTVDTKAVPTIDPSDYPSNEIGLLADRLSRAFKRIREFVAREQSFTRDASHELRTPIAVIRGAAELIALQPNLSPSSREALRRIDTATVDMAEALDLLLALARERDVQEWEPTLLKPLVEKALSDTTARFPNHGCAIELEIDHQLEVLVRPRLLQLILNNLIANSFQHSNAKFMTLHGSGNRLVIGDDGTGFIGARNPFEPYSKGTSSDGTGLGLDIVRRLCAVDDIELACRERDMAAGVEFILQFNRQYELIDLGNHVYKAI